MSINSDNSSLFDSTLSTSSASPASAASKKRKEETGAKGESHSEITEEQSHMTSSSFLESEAMNQLQQEISSRDVEEQLKEKEDKQPEDQVKRQKKAISEEVVEVPTDSISSPTLSSESLIIPSSIIFLGSSSSSPIPLSLADPRISESFSSSLQEPIQSSSLFSLPALCVQEASRLPCSSTKLWDLCRGFRSKRGS
jgi:ABC-type sugar transport system ATPase subunit